MEPSVHGRGRNLDALDDVYFGVHEKLLYAKKRAPVEGTRFFSYYLTSYGNNDLFTKQLVVRYVSITSFNLFNGSLGRAGRSKYFNNNYNIVLANQ